MADDRHYVTGEQAETLDEIMKWWKRQPRGEDPPQTKTVLGNPVPMQLAKAEQKIAAGSGGSFRIWQGNYSTSTGIYNEIVSTSTTREVAWDFLGRPTSSGDPAYLFRHQQSGRLYFYSEGYNRIRGFVASTDGLTTGTTSFAINFVTVIRGRDPVTLSTDEVTVVNTHNWDADFQALARAEWVQASSRWEAYQITCPVISTSTSTGGSSSTGA